MTALLVALFVLTYLAIAFEELLKVNKSATALIGAGVLWTLWAVSGAGHEANNQLSETLIGTAQIAFFLMGAMTVVEVIDTHGGFEIVTRQIRARSLVALIWIVCAVTFFLSAILDNLTTTIVMVALVRQLVGPREDRLYLAGLVVIAANAGGAWSPMGDVTTTMLWIGGQVSAAAIATKLILPSLVNLAAPLAVVSWVLRGRTVLAPERMPTEPGGPSTFERNLIFALGIGVLLAVPVFKAITHLPPWLGILLGLGLLWAAADLIHRGKPPEQRRGMVIADALTRIDLSAVIFFAGILLAVGVLEHAGVLAALAAWLDRAIGRLDVIVMLFGLLSAVVDNVPVVAAAMGMYPLAQHPADSFLWEFMAYCAGTGGSILIIGSAAGVAAMSIEKIEFFWYLRKFSLLALLGYLAGAAVYIAQAAMLAG
ncbi:MAG: sodium:proton antiporter NhaD [Pseudomonadota bacterium]|nr:sodium:proton antiporter NhaD [Pseudomonadota bacterium]